VEKTVSIKCPECGYIRYDLIHINDECGGLLLIDENGQIRCGLCNDHFDEAFGVTCPSCGYHRPVDVNSLFTIEEYRIVKMEVFETILF